ncbi:hypothetical protein AAMO2058_000819600 [Amorphochlora amoebiformis]|uniref:F-box domain-containing protein n=1 Tax=Amorphochlora amoebiformis TaxID=1561963 RepID=A0A7S0DLE5_9EUKA|mmetsp:Transcript_33044/g.53093  ORF Transcript_33044/g.53093 Transcript_33044/m.53093 type:complete len:257 (+) Transcript_33044:1-771(+)
MTAPFYLEKSSAARLLEDAKARGLPSLGSLVQLTQKILGFLRQNEIINVSKVSRGLYVTSTSDRVWHESWKRLVKGKVHVPDPEGNTWKQRYVHAVKESKRNEITLSELISLEWEFCYKRSIHAELVSMEPIFKNESPRRRKFDYDSGTLVPLTPEKEPYEIRSWQWILFNFDPAALNEIVSHIKIFGDIENSNQQTCFSGTAVIYWGHNTPFPILFAKRTPEWGWTLESSACIFSSIPLVRLEWIKSMKSKKSRQ